MEQLRTSVGGARERRAHVAGACSSQRVSFYTYTWVEASNDLEMTYFPKFFPKSIKKKFLCTRFSHLSNLCVYVSMCKVNGYPWALACETGDARRGRKLE